MKRNAVVRMGNQSIPWGTGRELGRYRSHRGLHGMEGTVTKEEAYAIADLFNHDDVGTQVVSEPEFYGSDDGPPQGRWYMVRILPGDYVTPEMLMAYRGKVGDSYDVRVTTWSHDLAMTVMDKR